jgi:toxin ParE1/3/4
MAKVIISPTALSDLNSIYDYIATDSEYHAERVVEKILRRVSVLELHIRIGKVVREFKNPAIRELIEPPYRIIYKIVSEDEISIAHVYHGSRLLEKM